MSETADAKDYVSIRVGSTRARALSEVIPTVPLHVSYEEYAKHLLHHIVQDATRWAYGVVFVELWVLDDTGSHLFRPEGGWSIEPSAYESKFVPLTDPLSVDYLPPDELAPGEGLPGMIFSTAGGHYHVISRGVANDDMLTRCGNKITWHPVKPIADDPDQPYNPRLKHLGECKLAAAGVTFKVGGKRGVVMYFARESSDRNKLEDSLNIDYMKHATMLIGSAYAHRVHRENVREAREHVAENGWKCLKSEVLRIHRTGECLAEHVKEQSQMKLHRSEEFLSSTFESASTGPTRRNSLAISIRTAFPTIRHNIKKFMKKWLGANVSPPPNFNWSESGWTFVGCFLTLTILSNINNALGSTYGPDYQIVMGPFGALLTLQYGLTSAPASQPRNIIIGQIFGMCVSFGIGESEIPLWLKQSLATSLTIFIMVKIGVTHPPAGATALLFSSGKYKIQQVGMNLMANLVALLMAVIINNADVHRQYPTFWGVQPSFCISGEKKPKTRKEE